VPPLSFEVNSPAHSMQNAGCQRRARQLSIVFYDYITSLLSCGEVCPELSELGFKVVQVWKLHTYYTFCVVSLAFSQ
jgi:hypothetical protein